MKHGVEYSDRVKFDDVDAAWTAEVAADVAEAALRTARLAAAERLVQGPITGRDITAQRAVDLLMRRDDQDPLWDTLEPYEQRWALLVIRAVDDVPNLAMTATDDARQRGTTWASIGQALGGITPQAAQRRLGRARDVKS